MNPTPGAMPPRQGLTEEAKLELEKKQEETERLHNQILQMAAHPGWKVLSDVLRYEADGRKVTLVYKKGQAENERSYLQGEVAGLEYAMRYIEQIQKERRERQEKKS